LKTLYLIRGAPGSGKSSFAHDLFQGGVVDAVIEADEYFIQQDGTYVFNPSLLGKAHSFCQERTLLALQSGNNVAVSNTSTTEKEVATYKQIADEVGTDDTDRLYDEAAYAFEIAQDKFFDNLNSNDKIESWKIINWE